ncbi:chaperonin-containing T-complex alpha subunit Cct1 [Ophidiomyces ophidiicola]|nr:chaperonin-containing T-complex alpha subunit Cct1 [Ophidiomyces ophidiicola]
MGGLKKLLAVDHPPCLAPAATAAPAGPPALDPALLLDRRCCCCRRRRRPRPSQLSQHPQPQYQHQHQLQHQLQHPPPAPCPRRASRHVDVLDALLAPPVTAAAAAAVLYNEHIADRNLQRQRQRQPRPAGAAPRASRTRQPPQLPDEAADTLKPAAGRETTTQYDFPLPPRPRSFAARKNRHDLSIDLDRAAPRSGFVKLATQPAAAPAHDAPRRRHADRDLVSSPVSVASHAPSLKMPAAEVQEIMNLFKQAYESLHSLDAHPTFETLQDAIIREINSHDAFRHIQSDDDDDDDDDTAVPSLSPSPSPASLLEDHRARPSVDRGIATPPSRNFSRKEKHLSFRARKLMRDSPTPRELSIPALKGLESDPAYYYDHDRARPRPHHTTYPLARPSLDTTNVVVVAEPPQYCDPGHPRHRPPPPPPSRRSLDTQKRLSKATSTTTTTTTTTAVDTPDSSRWSYLPSSVSSLGRKLSQSHTLHTTSPDRRANNNNNNNACVSSPPRYRIPCVAVLPAENAPQPAAKLCRGEDPSSWQRSRVY